MTNQELKELERLLEAIPEWEPTPWSAKFSEDTGRKHLGDRNGNPVASEQSHVAIAALRNAAPALLEMARLSSALEFVICLPGFAILNESTPGEPLFVVLTEDSQTSATSIPAAILMHAKELGLEDFE